MEQRESRASQHMIERGRRLRHEAAVPERLLWSRLRNDNCLGLKFRRQQPIGPYVVDFFCASAMIVVELDGRSHEGAWKDDVRRQSFLERKGYRVLRFTNDEVLRNIQGVAEAIAACCASEPRVDDDK